MKKIITIIGLTLLMACSSSGNFTPAKAPAADEALVYVYRPKSKKGSLISYTVMDGNSPVVKLKNGGYRPYYTKPGNKKFTAKTESTAELDMNLVGGQTYFIRGSINFGILVGRPKMEQVTDSTAALEELKGCYILEDLDRVE